MAESLALRQAVGVPPELVAAIVVGAVCGAVGGALLGAILGVVVAHHYGRLPGWTWAVIALLALALIVIGSLLGFDLTSQPQQNFAPSAQPTSDAPSPTLQSPSTPAQPSAAKPSSPPPRAKQAQAVLVNHYDDTGAAGEAVCTGNVNNPAAQPSGHVLQTFKVPSGFTTITAVLVQVDPQPALTVHLTLSSDSGASASASATASGDTRFTGLAMPVHAGETVTASFTMTSTQKTGVSMYVTPGGYGTVTFMNTCPWGGGANLTSTVQGLRMEVSGTEQ